MRLAGRTAIVTGATEGIGRAIAESFAANGARLVLVARRSEPGERLAAELDAVFVAGDVAHGSTAQAAVTAALERFGGLDVLVNNAGIDHSGDLLEIGLAEVERVLAVNFVGQFLFLQEAARAMRGRGGSIVNLTSRTAQVGVPTMALYGASKGALASLTRAAAVELAPLGIRVNAVAPGLTETPLVAAWLAAQDDPDGFRARMEATIPQGRFGRPEDVAAAVLYLASAESAHVTGVTLPVDGGYTAA